MRTDEEFTIAPLSGPSPTLAMAPPPYENPPPFEDTIKRTQVMNANCSRPRGEQGGRDEVASFDEVRR